ncbi:hypothetical protein KSP35_14990 [Aquihabitans sp. G128]|uniref:hypothetical protein n=1 Tax=Aquihabitans sp. G128 TaxID=2849779 RepID=UPI001C2293ED|nr:hypothetical protein [Aquihabitans sp. G128]QXC59682.1 hypothetical protein KSP35_14990 [Aquihabitans sp. G128]
MTVYLRAGRVYQAVAGVPTGNAQPHVDGDHHDERANRRRVVALVSAALADEGGWYYHDPLGRHDERGPWQWDVNGLLLDARAQVQEDRSLGRWADAGVDLAAARPDGAPTLSSEAWAVVVALADTVATTELRSRLGWSSERLVAALDDLDAAGALAPRTRRAVESIEPVELQRTPAPARPPTLAEAPPAPTGAGTAAEASARLAAGRTGLRSPDLGRGPDPDGVRPPAPAYALVGGRPPEPATGPLGAGVPGAGAAGPASGPRPGIVEPARPGDGDERRSALRRLIASLRPT